jgi:hypothetical protein
MTVHPLVKTVATSVLISVISLLVANWVQGKISKRRLLVR